MFNYHKSEDGEERSFKSFNEPQMVEPDDFWISPENVNRMIIVMTVVWRK